MLLLSCLLIRLFLSLNHNLDLENIFLLYSDTMFSDMGCPDCLVICLKLTLKIQQQNPRKMLGGYHYFNLEK